MCAATHRGLVAKKWPRHRELDNNAMVPGLGDLRRQRERVENSSLDLTALHSCLSDCFPEVKVVSSISLSSHVCFLSVSFWLSSS